MLSCRIWSFCVKGWGHEYRRTPKTGESWNSAFLGWGGRGWPQDTHPPHLCYHVKFCSSATKGVCINRKEPPNWGALEPCPLRWVRDYPLKQAPPHMSHVLSRQIWYSSASKGVRINRREHPKLASAGATLLSVGAWLTPSRNTLFLHSCYPAKFGGSRSNSNNVIKEIHLKNLTPRFPSFKVTQGHRNRHGSIRHLWLINVQ